MSHSSIHSSVFLKFIDSDNNQKTGIYRPIDEAYSPLSAMLAVAYSVRMRMTLGDSVAEESIVVDDLGNIQGTVSICPPDFKPMLRLSSKLPDEPEEKELVCPSVAMLLRYNFAEKLVAEVISENDDACPDNVSLFGLINHDRRGYRITRLLNSYCYNKDDTNKDFHLKSMDIDNFPNVKGRTYFPANVHPGNSNFCRHRYFMGADAVRELATNPIMKMEEGSISFQEQFFYAFLKELMVFDPDTLRTRLEEYLGDLPLDFSGLSSGEKSRLMLSFPNYFNETSQGKPFIDTVLKIFQDKHNEVYHTIVFYPGCEKNMSGVPVMSFIQYLHDNSFIYQQILQWGEENQLNTLKMKKCFHKICHDADVYHSTYWAKELLLNLAKLLNKPLKERFDFKNIRPPFDIDETLLNHMIEILEKMDTDLSLLACGLLLQGEIENFSERNHPLYLEKRLQDAITFYLKAAAKTSSGPGALMAQFLLWEMKTVTTDKRIKERLAYYDIQPPASYIPAYEHCTHDNSSIVKALLYPKLGIFSMSSTSCFATVCSNKVSQSTSALSL